MGAIMGQTGRNSTPEFQAKAKVSAAQHCYANLHFLLCA
jgi:hypothetical protein